MNSDQLLFQKEWRVLFEAATNLDLRSKARKDQPRVLRRAGPISSEFLGLRRGTQLWFRSTAITTSGVAYWYQIIGVKLPQKITGSVWNVVLKALRGDIKVKCTCPAFKYWGYWYILGGMEALFGHKTKYYPVIRNPQLKGSVCKHAYNVLTVLSANMPEIVKSVKKKRRIK